MTLLTPVLLLLLSLSGCFSEVVDDFSITCSDFFVKPNGIVCTPTVLVSQSRYKQICQFLHKENMQDAYEYATLYDRVNKIPVYSAYKFEGLMNCIRSNKWYIEPQLENREAGRSMASDGNVDQLLNQAVNKDYVKSNYHKGHLAPVLHANTQKCSDATFTLTNAAPQNSSFNQGKWRVTEEKVAGILTQYCKGNSKYIVTGVVPGTKKLKNRVCIPSHFWTAYACLDNNQRVTTTGAFIGENTNDVDVKPLSVRSLETLLARLYGENVFSVFCGHSNELITQEGRFSSVENLMQKRVRRCRKCSPAYYRKRCVQKVLHNFLHAKNKRCVRTAY